MANTKMSNAAGDLPVTRVGLPEHFSSEPDATHLYVPKSAQKMANTFRAGQGEIFSSMQPRIQLPYVADNSVRNLAVVATTTSAAMIDRQRSWKQLHKMSAAGNDCATEILKALEGFVIE